MVCAHRTRASFRLKWGWVTGWYRFFGAVAAHGQGLEPGPGPEPEPGFEPGFEPSTSTALVRRLRGGRGLSRVSNVLPSVVVVAGYPSGRYQYRHGPGGSLHIGTLYFYASLPWTFY